MKLQFLGANRQVTGSRYCLHANGARVLVDCGMFQERKYLGRNWEPSPVRPSSIDAILITHAHVDHCGLIPRLAREGFRGPIFTTSASADLVELVLEDSAEIQAEDIAWKKKRHRKEGRKPKHPEVPLFDLDDVRRVLPWIEPVGYGERVAINEHMSAVFHDAGHILGSAIVELNVHDNGHPRRVLFSGDLGQWNKPIIRDPTVFSSADYVVLESTYGDRDHENHGNVETQLGRIINETVEAGGSVVVPVFAIERAQELMYHLSRLLHQDKIPRVPVFLDSPMAVDVTAVFSRHRECFDEEAWRLIASGGTPLRFPELTMIRTTEESKGINRLRRPAIIMATSGMCTAGRIKHHLAHHVTRPESTLLFVGYQARGTLGRQILDGNPIVRIHGFEWRVRARVEQIQGTSGHADRTGLLQWLDHFQKPPRQLFLTHGDEDASLALAEQIGRNDGWNVSVPRYQDRVEL